VNLTLAEAAEAMNALGDLGSRSDLRLVGVSTDSRTLNPDELFFCLQGENFDGHGFADKAAAAGAVAIVAERPVEDDTGDTPVLMVPDSLVAIGRLGAYWRSRSRARVVAVTGSAGKTTVKEMLAGVLARAGETGKNYKNFNNQLGVPLSMLSFSGQEDFWVLELGISRAGDMEELGAMVRPDLAVVVNVGIVHTEGLGGLSGVARAKAGLLEFLAPGGRALVSMDHPPLWETAVSLMDDPIGFSVTGNPAKYTGEYLGAGKDGRGRFSVNMRGERYEFITGLVGPRGAENVTAVAAAADILGTPPSATATGLAGFAPPEQRFRTRFADGLTLIDDTYNANPLSMAASISASEEIAGEAPLVLVLGDMLELGREAGAEHERLGRMVARSAVRAVFYRGDYADDVARGLASNGRQDVFKRVESPAGFVSDFRKLGLDEAVLLFKGSRGLRMEELLEALVDAFSEERAS
jgi:UDP-N-acetylmuramoyl-tripeptide--D-alanyl-D-alanine ligase